MILTARASLAAAGSGAGIKRIQPLTAQPGPSFPHQPHRLRNRQQRQSVQNKARLGEIAPTALISRKPPKSPNPYKTTRVSEGLPFSPRRGFRRGERGQPLLPQAAIHPGKFSTKKKHEHLWFLWAQNILGESACRRGQRPPARSRQKTRGAPKR